MKLSIQRKFRWLRVVCCGMALMLTPAVSQAAPQTPAPTGHINDFAGVVDEQTRQQLESILVNVKLKTGIEFDIATVASVGTQDIFDFSR